MSLKAKLTSLIMTFMLLASLLVVGVFAVKSTSFNVGGDIKFTVKGIEATITRDSVAGFSTTDGKVVGDADGNILSNITLNNDMSAKAVEAEFAPWSGLNLEFEDGVTTATIVLTITNTVEGENPDNYLDISASANATTINNAEISVKNSTGGTTALLQQNESETFTITFKVIDDEYSASLKGFVVSFNLQKKTLAEIPTSEDVQTQNKIIVEKVDGQNYAQVRMVDQTTTSGDITVPSYLKVDNKVYPVTHVADYGFTDRDTVLAALAAGPENADYKALQEAGAKVENIILPDTITHIGQGAFASVMSLKSINIPEKVTSMGDGAFALTTSLESIVFETAPTIKGILSLNGLPIAFYGSSIKSVAIKKGDIFAGMFGDATTLENVELGDGVTSIGNRAFAYCSGLTSVTIPNSVTSIGDEAFEYCSGLTKVNISDIERFASISFGNYSANPLYYAKKLYLNDVLVEDLNLNVDRISAHAFYNATCLKSVILGENVKSISTGAFDGCSGLTSITIPASVTSIGGSPFNDCTNLTSIVVESGNIVYDSRNNCNAIIKTATNTLIQGCNTTVIPDGVTSIAEYAFYGCSSLTSITIPDSVTSIRSQAFANCSGLTSVVIGSSVTSIGNNAFDDCTGLTSITIPNSVTSIDYRAFDGCSSLKTVNYRGTEEQWNAISKAESWVDTGVTIKYNYTGE